MQPQKFFHRKPRHQNQISDEPLPDWLPLVNRNREDTEAAWLRQYHMTARRPLNLPARPLEGLDNPLRTLLAGGQALPPKSFSAGIFFRGWCESRTRVHQISTTVP
jgi:hypothetical protein